MLTHCNSVRWKRELCMLLQWRSDANGSKEENHRARLKREREGERELCAAVVEKANGTSGVDFDLVLPLRKLKQSERPQKQRSFYCSLRLCAFFPIYNSASYQSFHRTNLIHHLRLSNLRATMKSQQQQKQQEEKNTIKKQQQQQNLVRKRKPHFFKVLLGDFTHHLRIPPKFLKHIPGPVTESKTVIFLHGPSGSKWSVELRRNREGTFLASGWGKFVKDHSLKECEFVVFRYDGNMHFTVFLFDTTACEREDAFAVRRWKQRWKTRGRRPKEEPVEDGSCSVKQEIMKHGEEETKPLQIQSYLPTQERCVAFPDPIWNGKLKMEEFELPLSMIRNKSKYRRLCISSTRRRPVTDEEKLKAHKVANSFTSALPHTMIRMSTTTLFKAYMNIPTQFSRVHLPQNTSNLILHDPSDRSWVVNYIAKERGSKISRGWMAFVKANKLEEGDFCVFELVGTVELRVHIFRVVEETLPRSRVPTRSE